MKTIPLSQGKFALVDDEDFERLNRFKWCVIKPRNVFYAIRKTSLLEGRRQIYMHREVLGAPVGVDVDHKNGNGLDNQKENLRLATGQQNQQNARKRMDASSQFKGVYWCSQRNSWMACIHRKNEKKYLGYFQNEVEAARAYDAACKKYFGPFARPNFL